MAGTFTLSTFVGVMIPFAGTTLGSACVFFLKGEMSTGIRKTLTGFAAGVMVAASFWSLLSPSLDMAENMGRLAFVPAAVTARSRVLAAACAGRPSSSWL